MVTPLTSVPCPQKDGGLCNVPDPAVVISDGEFSLIRAKAVRRIYPNIESRTPRKVRLQEPIHYDELVRSVVESLASEVTIADSGEAEGYEPQFGAHILDAVASAVGADNGILVNCSCGHIFTV